MAAFVAVTSRGMSSQKMLLNLDTVAWMMSIGPQTTRVYFASLPDPERQLGRPFMIEVMESPEEIMGMVERPPLPTMERMPVECRSRQTRQQRPWWGNW